ncbi:RagB/SusD family nutrient uptake outer membrane protein [Parabacteroides merdae]|nr:RagB/SusD family nutrient uptake outer membrane protein [Parabacteroides merdae]
MNRANVLLNAIETGDLPAGDELNNAKGEALALRALCHFNLLITYGKPYFVENGATPGCSIGKNVLSADDLPSRSTVAEGYDMVINDLEEALKCIGTEVKDGRFNSWAVKGLLARVNLYKKRLG